MAIGKAYEVIREGKSIYFPNHQEAFAFQRILARLTLSRSLIRISTVSDTRRIPIQHRYPLFMLYMSINMDMQLQTRMNEWLPMY